MAKQILIIDDDQVLCALLKLFLTRAGFTVHTAFHGLTGLKLLSGLEPDLVMLDILMPHMNGWETCRRIRKTSTTPIIVMTVLDDELYGRRAFDMGADEFLEKPVQLGELLVCINTVLQRTSSSTENRS